MLIFGVNWAVYEASYFVNSGIDLVLEVLSPYQQYIQSFQKVFRPLRGFFSPTLCYLTALF